jgi:hypothetical protein
MREHIVLNERKNYAENISMHQSFSTGNPLAKRIKATFTRQLLALDCLLNHCFTHFMHSEAE